MSGDVLTVKPTRYGFYQFYIASAVLIISSIAIYYYGLVSLSAFLILASLASLLLVEAVIRGTTYVVGEKGITSLFKFVVLRENYVPYGRIQDMKVEKGIVGAILDFGDILINTAGSPTYEIVMRGLRRPDKIYDLIRNKYIEAGEDKKVEGGL